MQVQGAEGFVELDPGSGPQVYASVGLLWRVSENFSLEGRLRGQQSRLSGSTDDFQCSTCTYSNEPDGRLRGITVEGQITLTSVGRVHPYFLVGLGVVRTTIDAVRVTVPDGGEVQFSEVDVTDAGGDVGFGATTRIAGRLRLTAETRVTGSLPGAKENAVTAFPFTLGVSYEF
jgi:opacity protein-like surface antigen